jgi:hypothetical protein
MNLSTHPKVESLAAQALECFQSAAGRDQSETVRRAEDIKSGALKLSKAYALSQKVSGFKSPLPTAVAYLGLLNDLPPSPSPDLSRVSSLVNRHVDICGVLEEWSFARARGTPSTSENFHAAAVRFCIDSDLPQEAAGDQSQIAMLERIVHRFGANVSSPALRVEAIENLLTAVGQMTTAPAPESTPRPAVQQGSPSQGIGAVNTRGHSGSNI